MTWRDIDLEVVVTKLNKGQITKIIDHLLNLSKCRIDFTFIDNTNSHKPSMPTGFYLGIKYEVERDKTWKIDIWIIVSHANGYLNTIKLKNQLTEQTKLSILDIKNQVADHPKYKAKEIQSVDIYDAVLNHGVHNLEEFKTYLQKIRKKFR